MRKTIILFLFVFIVLFTFSVYADEMDPSTSINYNRLTHKVTYGDKKVDIPFGVNSVGTPQIFNNGNECNISTFNNNLISTDSVIFGDGRIKVNNTMIYPYNAIGRLIAYFSDNHTEVGSGTLLSSNVVLTSGHIIYQADHNGWATSIAFSPGMYYNGTSLIKPYGQSNYSNMTTTPNWTVYGYRDWDWAIVDLEQSYSNWMPFAYAVDYTTHNNTIVTVNGYPTDLGGMDQYYSSDTVADTTDCRVYYYCDTYDGMSGGPMIDPYGYVMGVHRGNSALDLRPFNNDARRINQDLFGRLYSHIFGE